jgi:methionine biosynthesis protein MetW
MTNTNLRPDLQIISNIIKNGSRVLDIGCFEGELLYHLAKHKNVDARGIELIQSNVSSCVKRGLAVIQGDADTDLKFYPDKCFDYVISSQMLQATRHPKDVLKEMLRLGKKVVVSIPNFGYWYNRLYLLINGRMPVSETLPYQWYETPNIHFSTIKDFHVLCLEIGCKIEEKIFLSPCGSKNVTILPNILGETGVFVLGKGN